MTKGLQLCFLWICDREVINQMWYSKWLKCLSLASVYFILPLDVADVLGAGLGCWRFPVVFSVEMQLRGENGMWDTNWVETTLPKLFDFGLPIAVGEFSGVLYLETGGLQCLL